MGRGHRLLALGRLAHLFLVSKASQKLLRDLSAGSFPSGGFTWVHASFLSRQILRVCILNGVCSELRSAACSASVLSKSVASSFTICDTEPIAVKRSGEHINKKSFNWWGTAVANCKHPPSEKIQTMYSVAWIRLSRRRDKCKRWALSICVMPMYVLDAQCVSSVQHVFDQTGLGHRPWHSVCHVSNVLLCVWSWNQNGQCQQTRTKSLGLSRLDCNFVLFEPAAFFFNWKVAAVKVIFSKCLAKDQNQHHFMASK